MPETFRVGITRDFLKADGTLAFGNMGRPSWRALCSSSPAWRASESHAGGSTGTWPPPAAWPGRTIASG